MRGKSSVAILLIFGILAIFGIFNADVGCTETLNADVVVIGAGGSGLAAAVTAAEAGARVIVFEKQPYTGGSSNFFEGVFAVESAMQRERYIGITRDEAFQKIMDFNHWRANPRLVRAFVDESAKTVEWLQKEGVEFTGPTINYPDGPRVYHVIKGYGKALIKALTARAQEKGVDIRLSTPAVKLVKENGRIVGVIAEKGGKPVEARAKAVIIATGGYGNNKEWIKKYGGFDLGVNLLPVATVGKVGDGIRMAWEAGAAEEGMGVMEVFRLCPFGPGIQMGGHLEVSGWQPELWVNQNGERFCDEGTAFLDSYNGNASARQKGGISYTVFDDSIKHYMMEKGVDRNIGGNNPPGTRLVNFDKEIKTAIEKGNPNVFMAGSIEELAKKTGMNAANLKATIAEYNRFCANGHDELFAKNPKYLRPLKGPKYYALRAITASMGTLGGIKVNEKMEAVDKDENPVPGLYAVGFDAGGLYGDSYSFKDASGTTAGFAVNSGRIAGRNAVKYIGK